MFLKLESLEVLLIGGGNIALEKLTALLSNSPFARIRVVASEIYPLTRLFLDEHKIPYTERPFQASDLDKIRIAVIAINNKEQSASICQDCLERNILVNVADTPDLCDFYLGSVVTKGQLKIGISTNGKSPTIAKRVKEALNEAFPEEIDELLANMEQIRNHLSGDFAEKVKKLNTITAILAKDSD